MDSIESKVAIFVEIDKIVEGFKNRKNYCFRRFRKNHNPLMCENCRIDSECRQMEEWLVESFVELKKKFGTGSEKDSTAACTMPKLKSRDSMEAGAVAKLRDNSDVSTKCSSEKQVTKKKAIRANIDWINKALSDLNRINGVE